MDSQFSAIYVNSAKFSALTLAIVLSAAPGCGEQPTESGPAVAAIGSDIVGGPVFCSGIADAGVEALTAKQRGTDRDSVLGAVRKRFDRDPQFRAEAERAVFAVYADSSLITREQAHERIFSSCMDKRS